MSSIKLTGDTSGEITISAPAVAGTNTLTLPADTGTFMTSTYTGGDVDIDSGTLHVDATNNRVGIGTSSPSSKFHVVGGQSYVTGSSGNGAYSRWYNNAQTSSDLQIGQGWSSGSDNIGFVLNNANADLLFGTNGSERMRINSNGKVAIGSNGTGNGVALQIDGSTAPDALMSFKDTRTDGASGVPMCYFQRTTGTIGTITTTTSSTAYNTSSDYRLKENVAPMSGSIDRLKQLKPSTWSWVQDGSHGEGFLAHEAQTVVPEAVHGTHNEVDDDGNPVYQGIDQSKLVPLLTAALQEAITKIEDLETRIQALENA